MENRPAPAADHEQACETVSRLFPQRWLRHYVAGKLRSDPVFRAAYDLLHNSPEPILDVGCGVGLLAFYLRQRGSQQAVTGLDIDTQKIYPARTAALTAGYGDLRFLEQNVSAQLPDFQGHVVAFDVLHYLQPAAQKSMLTALAARVSPGGMLLLRDCPRDGSARFWATYIGEVFAQTILWNIAAPLNFPTRESINAAFSANEFTHEEQPMFGHGPFNNRLFIFRRKSGLGHLA